MVANSNENAVKQFGTILKVIRKEKGYSREHFAERVGITPRFLTAMENEDKKPSCETFYAIIRVLGVSADKFLYPEGQDNDDAEEIKNLYMQCSERDKKIVRNIIDAMLDKK